MWIKNRQLTKKIKKNMTSFKNRKKVTIKVI